MSDSGRGFRQLEAGRSLSCCACFACGSKGFKAWCHLAPTDVPAALVPKHCMLCIMLKRTAR